MRKRKFLSILLTLALVFSTASAFTVAVNADEESPVALTGYNYDKVTSVNVGGQTLSSNTPYLANNESEATADKPASGGYAYFDSENGRLELNNFEFVSTENAVVSVTGSGVQTLYVDIVGTNEIEYNVTEGEKKAAIYGENVYLVFSEKQAGSKLTITSSWDGIKSDNGYVNILSGEYNIDCGNVKASCIYAGKDISIDGGTLNVKDANCGTNSGENTYINGGNINIDNCADSGIKASGNTTINTSSIVIKNCGNGTYTYGNKYSGIYSSKDTTINGGNITIDNCGNTTSETYYQMWLCMSAVYSGVNTTINGGNIAVNNCPYGVVAKSKVNILGGSLSIGDFKAKAENEQINPQEPSLVSEQTSEQELSEITQDTGISGSGVTINNAKVSIKNVNRGIWSGNVDIAISNSTVDITSVNESINADNAKVTIKNSDVKAFVTETETPVYALNDAVTVYGNPAIYAGDTEKDAKRIVLNGKDLSQYSYVHIYNCSSVVLSKISNTFTNMFKAIFNLNNAKDFSYLNNSMLWKAISNIFHIS